MDNGWLIILLAGVVVFAIFKYLDHRRTQAVRQVARQLGFTYREMPQSGFSYRATSGQFIDSRLNQAILCSKGKERRLKNVIKGRLNNMQISIGDYSYTTGLGKRKSTHRQTIVILDCNQHHLPTFALIPENIFHKVGNLLGYPDINFNNYPKFSKRYRLTGPDRSAIQSCFTTDILTFFEAHGDFCVEAVGGVFLYYKRGYSVRPQEWRKLINSACRVYSQF